MNKFKKITICFAAIGFILSACSGGEGEYVSLRSFEFHFYREEYEEEYSTVSKTLPLDAKTDYKLQLDANCESGTMNINVLYDGTDENEFFVDEESPCSELLTIPADTVSEITVTISIDSETKGAIIGDLMSK